MVGSRGAQPRKRSPRAPPQTRQDASAGSRDEENKSQGFALRPRVSASTVYCLFHSFCSSPYHNCNNESLNSCSSILISHKASGQVLTSHPASGQVLSIFHPLLQIFTLCSSLHRNVHIDCQSTVASWALLSQTGRGHPFKPYSMLSYAGYKS